MVPLRQEASLQSKFSTAAAAVPCLETSILPSGASPLLILTDWYECLHGGQPLVAGLQRLSQSLAARSICLSRHSRESPQTTQVLTTNDLEIMASSIAGGQSYAHCVLGIYIDRPKAGSVWLSSAVQERISPRLQEFQAQNKIAETAVIPLAVGDKQIDYLELHFVGFLSDAAAALLNSLAEALSRTWMCRSPGLFAGAISAHEGKPQAGSVPKEILSRTNPYGLTRSQVRVCVVLRQGLNTKSTCSELMISEATLRSHLRSIYRKTCTRSFTELVSKLLMEPRFSFGQEAHWPRRTA